MVAEVQRVQADAHPKLTALARRVASLNPNCAEIGAGMLATLVSEAHEALIPAKAGIAEPHPSRSAKVCADCKHLSTNSVYCFHPAVGVSLVTGKPDMRAESMRSDKTIFVTQKCTTALCGPGAELFENAEGVAA